MNDKDLFSLAGKVAVVTGGGSHFGKQVGVALSRAGAKTYISTRNPEHAPRIEAEYRALGCEVQVLQLDQGREDSVEAFNAQICAESDHIDILVNNAVAREMAHFHDTAGFIRSMQINATGLYQVTKVFGDVMKAQGSGGSIINIGSIYGAIGPDASMYEGLGMDGYGGPDYTFHKGGMMSLTRFIGSYYGPYNVRCNCVILGGLQSERNSAEFRTRYGNRTFLGRMANETDLIGPIVFLASEASAYVTGTCLTVDGGFTAK